MKLLDTNVVIYARGMQSPYRAPCIAILDDARERPDVYGMDVEALQEVLDVYNRRRQRPKGVEVVEDLLTLFSDPLPITAREIEQATGLLRRHDALSPRDAIHAAVVLTHGLEGIVSADDDFDGVTGLTRFDPLELAGG